MSIKKLKDEVISKIQSSCDISKVSECVVELILNSLDAKSNAIAVRVNLVTYRIQVVDNGIGISKKDMINFGYRYMTNKCCKIEDLEENIKSYGVRGESLASIINLSKSLQVTSKYQGSEETYTKCINGTQHSAVIQCSNRPSYGTTITIEGFFYNLPVRKKIAKPELELQDIKNHVEHLIVFHPKVSFTLRNDVTGDLLISSQKQTDVIHAFLSIHTDVPDNFVLIKIAKESISIKGLIHKEKYKNRKLQFVYVNKRPVFNTEIQKCVCNLLKKEEKTKQKLNGYHIFIVNVKCPYSEVNILQNTNGTLIHFKNWSVVERCLEKMVAVYSGNNKPEEKVKKVKKHVPKQCSVSNVQGAVKGRAFKRKAYIDEVEKLSFDDYEKELTPKKSQHNETYVVDQIEPSLASLKSPIKPHLKDNKKINIINHFVIPTKQPRNNKPATKKNKPKQTVSKGSIFKSKRDKPIKFNLLSSETENNYSIYFSDKEEIQNYKKPVLKHVVRKPLPVEVETKIYPDLKSIYPNQVEQTYTLDNNFSTKNNAESTFYSRFTDNEDKGKDLIMDMFLKSTQVYSNDPQTADQSLNSSEGSVYESNFVFKNNNKTEFHDVNTTMSVSVVMKRKLLKEHKKREKYRKMQEEINLVNQGVQTTFSEKLMMSEGIQTTFNRETKHRHNIPKKLKYGNMFTDENPDNYTILLPNTNENDYKFALAPRVEPIENLFEENYLVPQTCVCRKNDPMFKLGKRDRSIIVPNNISPIYKEKCKNNISLMNVTKTEDSLNIFPLPNRPNLITPKIYATKNQIRETCPYYCNIHMDHNKNKNPIHENTPYFNNLPEQSSYFNIKKDLNTKSLNNKSKSEEHNRTKNTSVKLTKWNSDGNQTFQNFKPRFFSTQNVNHQTQTCNFPSPQIQFLNNTVNNFNSSISNMFKFENFIDTNQNSEAQPSRELYNKENWTKEFNEIGDLRYVNKRTGLVKSQIPQSVSNLFEIKERPEFIPKGLSPILQKKIIDDLSMGQISKEKLHGALLENCDDLSLLNKEKYSPHGDPKKLFENLYQEKVRLFEDDIPAANPIPKQLRAVKLKVFQRDVFTRLTVIGQVDNKFIATFDPEEQLIIIFDQHAVHERIRLEKLQKDYKNSRIACSQITIFVQQIDIELLKENADYLSSLGLTVSFFTNCVNITEIPLCLENKIKSEKDKNLNKYIEMLIQEIIDLLKERKVSSVSVPSVLQDMINMEACRGAIKFGDIISRDFCTKLILDLSQCDLPFQCAHGRPTLTPLIHYNELSEKQRSIHFENLK